jgi:MFS family permease
MQVSGVVGSRHHTLTWGGPPTIVADLHGFNLYGWVFTAYMLASTVSVPIFGSLSDAYGRRSLSLLGWGEDGEPELAR